MINCIKLDGRFHKPIKKDSMFYCINLDGRFHRPRKSDYQWFIVSTWMEDSIGQERVTIKALLYQPGWKIP